MTSSRTVLAAAVAAAAVLLVGCGSNGTTSATTSSNASAATSSGTSAGSGSSSAAPASGSASGSARTTPSGSAAPTTGPSEAAMEQYCQQSGGQVQTRTPSWNTNSDQAQWLALGGSSAMCRFQADDEAKSRIYVDLTTLSSTEPTLAGLAYLSKVPMPSASGGGNPATAYCSTELNGSSSFGGAGASGGGWVNQTDPDDIVVSLCVFPDGSFIDEWGLAYHSAGDIRGKDLATVMKYEPSGSLPPVFPTS